MTRCDVIVVGQGLAGTALAWCLRWRGLNVVVVDDGTPSTASRVAAGLITPVTGRRLTTTEGFDRLRDVAVIHYRRVSDETGVGHVFDDSACCRLFASEDDRHAFQQKVIPHARLASPGELPDPNDISSPFGGFVMPSALRLHVGSYLSQSHRAFRVVEGGIDPATDVTVSSDDVTVQKMGVSAEQIVFCTGLGSPADPWFGRVRFEPAKGEVLNIHIPELRLPGTVHGGVWLTPLDGEQYLCGSTYSQSDSTTNPTATGRAEIERKLGRFLRLPYTVTGHSAGIRPITPGRRPVLGFHPDSGRVAVLTGLSSKGALFAPFYAEHLAAAIQVGGQIAADVDIKSMPEFAR